MMLAYSSLARQQLAKLPPVTKGEMRIAIEQLQGNPYLGKPLQRDLVGLRSLAVKRYRVIYEICVSEKELQFFCIRRRGDVYELAKAYVRQGKERH